MQKVKAIVLKNQKYKEADLLVRVLTTEGESLHLRAPSALKSKRRFYPGTLEPTHYIAFSYNQATRPHWPILLEAQVLNDFSLLRQSFDRLQVALYCVRLVERVSYSGAGQGEAVFNLLGHTLRLAQGSAQLPLLKLQFELKFLYLQGMLPAHWVPSCERFLNTSIVEHESLSDRVLSYELRSHLATQIKEYVGL